jgi:two-component system, OmpR family, copper resistance phosphate regulon response regulator CusR
VNVLLVEDEDRIASFVQKGLAMRGFGVRRVATAGDAVVAVEDDTDVVLLDLGLPDGDGLDVLSELRARGSTVPVVILTARSEVDDRVTGLDRGAEDYVPKPFSIEELAARLRARVRDRERARPELHVGRLTLDLVRRIATVADREVPLTPRECTLLETLMREPSRTFTRPELLEAVWGLTFDPGSNLVEVFVRALRRKLEPGVIRTVRGVGYAVGEPPSRRSALRT